jgi:hypothetical protein
MQVYSYASVLPRYGDELCMDTQAARSHALLCCLAAAICASFLFAIVVLLLHHRHVTATAPSLSHCLFARSNNLHQNLQTALSMLEVALELWLALTVSPQARLLRRSSSPASSMLQVCYRTQHDVWSLWHDAAWHTVSCLCVVLYCVVWLSP